MTEVLTGQCSDAQIAALLVALHMKGETVEEIVGFAEAIRAAAIPLELHADSVLDASGTGRDALGRYLRHRRRCQRHLQYFNGNGLRRRWSRRARRQARQPQRDLKVRLRRRDGSVGREHPPAGRAGRGLPGASRNRVSFRPGHAFRDEARADRPPRTATAHSLQPARSADQSRARHLPGSWCLFRGPCRKTCGSAQHVRIASRARCPRK